MPVFKLECPSCFLRKRAMGATFDSLDKSKITCECGATMAHSASGPGSTLIERLDNGLMPRAVERIADIERIMADRRAKADPLAGKKNYS